MLHTFHDGSVLRQITAKQLIGLPVWKGNRILDTAHATGLKAAIQGNVKSLDSSIFRIVKYNEMDASNHPVLQTYVIDGQHRASILREYFQENLCEPDFPVVIIEKTVESESDAIEYFNILNTVKPQQWEHDPVLLANKYLEALCKAFNTDRRNLFIRSGITKRPYVSCDQIRKILLQNVGRLKQSKEKVEQFIGAVRRWNTRRLEEYRITLLGITDNSMVAAVDKQFTLAYTPNLPWISECL